MSPAPDPSPNETAPRLLLSSTEDDADAGELLKARVRALHMQRAQLAPLLPYEVASALALAQSHGGARAAVSGAERRAGWSRSARRARARTAAR